MSAEADGMGDHAAWSVLHLCLAPGLVLGGAVMDCWSARLVWGWFIEQTFGAWPGSALFFGAWFLAHILTHQATGEAKDKTRAEMLFASIGWTLLRPLIVVGCAWLVWKALV